MCSLHHTATESGTPSGRGISSACTQGRPGHGAKAKGVRAALLTIGCMASGSTLAGSNKQAATNRQAGSRGCSTASWQRRCPHKHVAAAPTPLRIQAAPPLRRCWHPSRARRRALPPCRGPQSARARPSARARRRGAGAAKARRGVGSPGCPLPVKLAHPPHTRLPRLLPPLPLLPLLLQLPPPAACGRPPGPRRAVACVAGGLRAPKAPPVSTRQRCCWPRCRCRAAGAAMPGWAWRGLRLLGTPAAAPAAPGPGGMRRCKLRVSRRHRWQTGRRPSEAPHHRHRHHPLSTHSIPPSQPHPAGQRIRLRIPQVPRLPPLRQVPLLLALAHQPHACWQAGGTGWGKKGRALNHEQRSRTQQSRAAC